MRAPANPAHADIPRDLPIFFRFGYRVVKSGRENHNTAGFPFSGMRSDDADQ